MNLNDLLLAAHAAGDHAALVDLYEEAALTVNDEDAKGFFLTHAYIFALEQNHPKAATLKTHLIRMGREED